MYEKIKLDYNLNDLAPYIGLETMLVHYDTLYTRYLENLNNILLKNDFSFSIPKEEIYNIIERFPLDSRDTILFNLGGVLNHELYFGNLTNNYQELKEDNIIFKEYKSLDNFIEQVTAKAKEVRGSGYTFLVIDKDKNLALVNLPNQDNPYRLGVIPIMNLDLWEHAYFLDYKANKDEYIKNFFKILDFEKINERYKIFSENIC